MPLPPEGVQAKRRRQRQYNSTYKRLQQQAAHLEQLLEQEQQAVVAIHSAQLLLAEGILQHKVVNQLLRPLQDKLMQPADSSSPSSGGGGETTLWLSEILQELQRSAQADWAGLLELSSPLLRPALQTTPPEVKALATMSLDVARQLSRVMVNKTLLVTELLSPARFPEELLLSQPTPRQELDQEDSLTRLASQAAGTAGVQQLLALDLNQAATELLTGLQEFRKVMDDVLRSSLLLMLHDPHTLASLGHINLDTGEPCSLPSSHYLKAARRLHLTSCQIHHLQLALQQYNRMARLQNLAGQQVVGMSQNSFSLQASLSSGLKPEPGNSGAPSKDGAVLASGAAAGGEAGQQASGQGAAVAAAAAAAEKEAGGASPQAAVLEELLARHVHDTLDLMTVVSMWAMSTLTPWQLGQYLVACWPYFPWLPALVEVSAFLMPHDSPAVEINAACCDAAAQAAALAAEVGYMDPLPFMQRRVEHLETLLEWALQNAQQLLG